MYSEQGGAVWQIDPTSHKKRPLMRNPSTSYEVEGEFEMGDGRVLYAHKRLYLGADDISEPSSSGSGSGSGSGKKTPLAVVFGHAK
ncbi:hypothetical protein [Streptomyces iconiensis]|uniref:Uncharacterized protein n=1 Tax=Streptomyces iconiensis TaxID=1384038 RepID=A0ABT7A9V5_9ACTN|nr:hypothetical protein [Streptomyces iconiensis]MDJ1138139.1 hypothetical protein [Streptomyces iconiensis]